MSLSQLLVILMSKSSVVAGFRLPMPRNLKQAPEDTEQPPR